MGPSLVGIPSLARSRFKPLVKASGSVETLGTARNLVFIHLRGGPSHIDCFDLKTGYWTPDRLGASKIGGFLDWPKGTMPRLAEMTHKFSLLRGHTTVEVVHERAHYQLLTSYRQNPSTVPDVPHFASLLSLLLEPQREGGHVLPTAVSVAQPRVGSGKLPSDYQISRIDNTGALPNLNHRWQFPEDRFSLLDPAIGPSRLTNDKRLQFKKIREQSKSLTLDEDLKAFNQTYPLPPLSGDIYDQYYFGQARAAVKILAANMGTRIAVLDFPGWDHHSNIYNASAGSNIFNLSQAFDHAASYLIEALEGLPASLPGNQSLFDETLVVATGEFGRTVGSVSGNGGREHLPAVSPVFVAGGGVIPGQVIGATNTGGNLITDRGWRYNRRMGPGDLLATIYSALDLDWNQRIQYTPTGRVYDVVDSRNTGPLYPIETLFG